MVMESKATLLPEEMEKRCTGVFLMFRLVIVEPVRDSALENLGLVLPLLLRLLCHQREPLPSMRWFETPVTVIDMLETEIRGRTTLCSRRLLFLRGRHGVSRMSRGLRTGTAERIESVKGGIAEPREGAVTAAASARSFALCFSYGISAVNLIGGSDRSKSSKGALQRDERVKMMRHGWDGL